MTGGHTVSGVGLAVILSVSVTGCSFTGPPSSPSTGTSTGGTVLVREALPTLAQDLTVLAATGDVIWAKFPDGSSRERNRISIDGGRSWQPGISFSEITHATGSRGRFGYVAGEDAEGAPAVMDASAPAAATALRWDDEGGGWHAVGVGAALNSHDLLMTSAKPRRVTFPALPDGAGGAHEYAFTGDTSLVVRITSTTGMNDYAGLVDVPSARGQGILTLPAASQHQVAGSTIYSVVTTDTGLELCRQPLPSGTARCVSVSEAGVAADRYRLVQFGDVSVIGDPASATALLVQSDTVTPIQFPTGTVGWAGDGAGDPTRPLLRTVDASGEPHHLRVEQSGETTEWITLERRPDSVASLALTPTTVLGSWLHTRPDEVWARTLSSGGLGQPTLLPGSLVDAASAGRWLVRPSISTPQSDVYDHGAKTGSIAARATEMSGPYVHVDGGVRVITGAEVATSDIQAIFGRLLVERNEGGQSQGVQVVIRDPENSASKVVPVQLSDSAELYGPVSMWGDWVGATITGSTSPGLAVAVNTRNEKRLTKAGTLFALGDGFAVLLVEAENSEPSSPPTDELAIWNLESDQLTRLGAGTSSSSFAICGDRIAYTTATDLVVQTIPGVGRSRPRSLGALTTGQATPDSPWTLELDATKPLLAGTVTITDPAGTVVATLPTQAAPTGSIRGISWAGPPEGSLRGRYRWTLTAAAADGTGDVVDVNGQGLVEGWLEVS